MTPYTDTDLETDFRTALDQGDHTRINALARLVDDRHTAPTVASLHAAALWYAEQGLKVFPLSPGSKIPFKGSNGCKGASNNPDVVDGWWTDTPDANIGIATGHVIDVVDIDGPGGVRSYLEVVEELPRIYGRVLTPRPGGMHLYVAAVPGRGNRAGILPHLDYRGAGGYVVAPPSINDQGSYRWLWPLDVTALRTEVAA